MSVKPDIQGTRKLSKKLEKIERQLQPSVLRTLNRTFRRARTYSTKEIGRQTGLKAADIKKDIVGRKASRQKLEAIVRAKPNTQKPVKSGSFNLIHFGARELRGGRGGVSFRTAKSGGRRKLKHAFLMTPSKGGPIVALRRKGPEGRVPSTPRKGGGRKPRDSLIFPKGPGVDQVFRDVKPQAEVEAREFMRRDMARDIVYRTRKAWAS